MSKVSMFIRAAVQQGELSVVAKNWSAAAVKRSGTMSTGIPGTGFETGQETGPDIGQGTAKAGERKTIFDPADRARLRAALIGYMRENDIGVLPLHRAHRSNCRAPGKEIDNIPQKTLAAVSGRHTPDQ